jgi:hypothetical protein
MTGRNLIYPEPLVHEPDTWYSLRGTNVEMSLGQFVYVLSEDGEWARDTENGQRLAREAAMITICVSHENLRHEATVE